VSETTISNCWRKTGILPRAPDSEIATASQYLESDIEIDNNEIATIIANLPSNDDPNALEVTLAMERYIQTIDEPVITEDILSDQDIVAMVRSEEIEDNEQESEDEALPPPLVTVTEVYNAMQTVLRYEEQADSESNLKPDELQFLRKMYKQYRWVCEKSKKQTSITRFFIQTTKPV
jgi:hypothetical protein